LENQDKWTIKFTIALKEQNSVYVYTLHHAADTIFPRLRVTHRIVLSILYSSGLCVIDTTVAPRSTNLSRDDCTFCMTVLVSVSIHSSISKMGAAITRDIVFSLFASWLLYNMLYKQASAIEHRYASDGDRSEPFCSKERSKMSDSSSISFTTSVHVTSVHVPSRLAADDDKALILFVSIILTVSSWLEYTGRSSSKTGSAGCNIEESSDRVLIRTDPSTGSSRPRMSLKMVDFPEEEAPTNNRKSLVNDKSTFSTANSRRGSLEVNLRHRVTGYCCETWLSSMEQGVQENVDGDGAENEYTDSIVDVERSRKNAKLKGTAILL
jgi:hypothetical protein